MKNKNLVAALVACTMTFFSSALFAESCYKVNIKQKIDTEKCLPVPVVLTVFECASPGSTLDEKTLEADVNCKANPVQLKIKYKALTLTSETEPASGWGGINFRVVKTTSTNGTAAKDTVPAQTSKVSAAKLPAKVRSIAANPPAAPTKKNEHKVPTEEAVQSNASSVKQEAKVKDAGTGEVAPAKPSGTIEVPHVDKVISTDAQTGAQVEKEIPVNIKFSGFAWVENEDSQNFGYNGASAIPNFDSSASQSQQSLATFFSNLQMDISKDKTNFTTILEIGEMINGEVSSGGVQGGRKTVLEVRNAYLTHAFDSRWSLKAGLLPLSSDPNAFIIADHFTAAVVDHKQERFTASLWSAKGASNKPGLTQASTSPAFANADQYWGVSLQPKISESSNLNAYAVIRKSHESLLNTNTSADIVGRTQSTWYGATFDQALNDRFSFQVTGILNNVKFAGPDDTNSESYRSHLFDAKFIAAWKDKGFGLLVEALATPGASNTTDATGKTVLGSRRGFSSVGPAYLFTIANSDGVDDAPGTAKETTIASLNQAEGLQVALVKASQAFTDKLSGFVRVGTLRTAAPSSTGSSHLGDEVDLNATYELSPGTTLQMDYGYFKPGPFFEKREAAHLMSTRLKFSF
jgi:hypothetical protein